MKKIAIACFTGSLLFVIGVCAYKLRAGFTPPILDGTGQPLPGSIASLEKIELNGMEQWLLIRGKSTSNPVLLWLHGGPGAAQMPIARHFNGALEDAYVVVHWDQRGAGKSNPADFDETSMTFQQYLDDAHALTLYLKTRFGQEKIYLLGHSWGAQLGLRLAQAYPQDYFAYIGVSQVVSPPQAQRIAYEWLIGQVEDQKNEADRKKLQALGQPPFREHERYVEFVRLIDAYGGDFDTNIARLAWITFRGSEYNLSDMRAWLNGANRGSGNMWDDPAYQFYDAFVNIPRVEIPVYLLNGTLDYNTPAILTQQYYNQLEAPAGKHLIIFESSAHTPFLGEAEAFNTVLIGIRKEIETIRE